MNLQTRTSPASHYHHAPAVLDNVSDNVLLPSGADPPPLLPHRRHCPGPSVVPLRMGWHRRQSPHTPSPPSAILLSRRPGAPLSPRVPGSLSRRFPPFLHSVCYGDSLSILDVQAKPQTPRSKLPATPSSLQSVTRRP